MGKKVIKDLIKSNEKLKGMIIERLNELNLTQRDVVQDARLRGMKIDGGELSRYVNFLEPVSGSLSQEKIVWLALRYGIKIKLLFGDYYVDTIEKKDGTSIRAILKDAQPYNEKEAIDYLEQFFPNKARM